MTEQPLEGGNASGAVVRVGGTVRKPWTEHTPRVASYLRALRERGVGVPEHHGRDEQGRQVLDFVPGTTAIELEPLGPDLVHRVGELLRRLHDASADLEVPDDWPVLIPAPGRPELVCHNDVATWNLVVDGDRLALIDWDGAGPSTRLWDLAYAAVSFGGLWPGADVTTCATRLRAFVEGYRPSPDLVDALPAALAHRAGAMHDLLARSHADGVEPWASMFVEGHGEHWAGTASFARSHEDVWRRAVGGGFTSNHAVTSPA